LARYVQFIGGPFTDIGASVIDAMQIGHKMVKMTVDLHKVGAPPREPA